MEPIDPGIVGVTYQAPMTLQDAENAINWYVEVAEVGSAKMPVALLGTPGLNPIVAGGTASVRGVWPLPGGTQALAVIGNQVYLLTATATTNGQTTFSLTTVGTLLTESGPVSIRDNGDIFGGEGGFAVIVDGQYGYYYRIGGATTIQFPGAVTSGDAYITVSDIPNGLVAGTATTVTDSAGYIPTSPAIYTGTITPGGAPNNTGFISGSYGSISPTSDSNGHAISELNQNYTGFLTLQIASAASLTQSYFASLNVGGNIFYSTAASFSFSAGVNTWIWSGAFSGMQTGKQINWSYQSSAPTLFTGADFNNVRLNINATATGTNSSDTITVTIPAFGQITDPAFLPASRIAFIEGWLIFSQPGTRTFFTNATTPYTLLFSGLFYALMDSSSDNLVTLQENERELWLVGERTSEVWYNSGGASFPFSRLPGVGPQIGCSATASQCRVGENLYWLASNEQGQNMVVRQVQYSWERVSNHAIEHAITQYAVISDAIGYGYEEEGHFFYVLTFPTADATWVYDATASAKIGKPCWHQRASLDVQGIYHRHRSNCFMNFAGMRLVGDYQSGQIHQMSRQFYTDAGNPLRCQRRSPHLWDKPSRQRMFYSWMQFEFTPGVGLQSGQGSNPQMMLRWSSDGGFSWSQEVWLPIGKAGQTRNRAVARALGYAYDRVWEINYSDPTPRDLIGATLYAEPEI